MNQVDESMVYMFHAESMEILNTMENSLLFLQDNGTKDEELSSIFRAIHTIKGGAAIFEYDVLVKFTHTAESLLDKIRNKEIAIEKVVISLLLNVKDHIENMINEIIQNDCQEVYNENILILTSSLTQELQNALEVKPIEVSKLEELKSTTDEEKNDSKIQVKPQVTLKIEAQKIDKLIDLLGEMVITTANISEHSTRLNDKNLKESVDSLSKLLEELREVSTHARMIPISDTFNKYKRVVRDLSLKLNKEVELKISGAETELDKTIIEKISDPIMHIVRNSLDHGIESKEAREKAGKPQVAKIHLSAIHESGNVIIKIEDDGTGLNKEKILEKALEKGLISKDKKLSDDEVYHLIFHAGFSTASSVSNISGRGVGMDVVKKNIEELRGFVEIETQEGIGTSIIIKLPLTLAIIDGFMVKLLDQSYIIPLDMIEECVELTQDNKKDINKNKFINLREHILPILDLRDFFHYEKKETHKRGNVVVVHFSSYRVGLIVDEIVGEFQTVIKPMSRIFQNLKGIGSVTILGDGKVAPILDVPMLLKYANQKYGEK